MGFVQLVNCALPQKVREGYHDLKQKSFPVNAGCTYVCVIYSREHWLAYSLLWCPWMYLLLGEILKKKEGRSVHSFLPPPLWQIMLWTEATLGFISCISLLFPAFFSCSIKSRLSVSQFDKCWCFCVCTVTRHHFQQPWWCLHSSSYNHACTKKIHAQEMPKEKWNHRGEVATTHEFQCLSTNHLPLLFFIIFNLYWVLLLCQMQLKYCFEEMSF